MNPGFARFNQMHKGLVSHEVFLRAIRSLHLYKLEDRRTLAQVKLAKERSQRSEISQATDALHRRMVHPGPQEASALRTWWADKVQELRDAGRLRPDGTIKVPDQPAKPLSTGQIARAFPALEHRRIKTLRAYLYSNIG